MNISKNTFLRVLGILVVLSGGFQLYEKIYFMGICSIIIGLGLIFNIFSKKDISSK